MKISIFIISLLFSTTSCFNGNSQVDEAKSTVQLVFKMCYRNNYDSIRQLIPILRNDNDDYIALRLIELNNFIKVEGVPDMKKMHVREYDEKSFSICSIKIIPSEPDKIKIDSIIFDFKKYPGTRKVSMFKLYGPPQIINTK